ncbi:hypothetical protein C8R44DRAFT_791484, partial [Mycena epipterygia]
MCGVKRRCRRAYGWVRRTENENDIHKNQGRNFAQQSHACSRSSHATDRNAGDRLARAGVREGAGAGGVGAADAGGRGARGDVRTGTPHVDARGDGRGRRGGGHLEVGVHGGRGARGRGRRGAQGGRLERDADGGDADAPRGRREAEIRRGGRVSEGRRGVDGLHDVERVRVGARVWARTRVPRDVGQQLVVRCGLSNRVVDQAIPNRIHAHGAGGRDEQGAVAAAVAVRAGRGAARAFFCHRERPVEDVDEGGVDECLELGILKKLLRIGIESVVDAPFVGVGIYGFRFDSDSRRFVAVSVREKCATHGVFFGGEIRAKRLRIAGRVLGRGLEGFWMRGRGKEKEEIDVAL